MSYFSHPIFNVLLDTLGPEQSMLLASFIEHNDVLGLVTQSVDRSQPVTFSDVFFKEMFRKVSDAPLGIDTAQVAISGFLEVEKENSVTNSKLRNLKSFIEKNPSHQLAKTIFAIKDQIARILGPAPRIEPVITFGATYDLKRNSSVFRRLKSPTVSSVALNYLRAEGYIRSDYSSSVFPRCDGPNSPFGSVLDDFTIQDSVLLATVGKTSLTDRCIIKNQTVDVAYQCGAGRAIKERLLAFGLDINTSAEKHKLLAKLSSVTGLLATEDLVSASDRIVIELIKLLLADDWYHLLNSLRATHVEVEGTNHKLEMFSSAGNGFTFELETLIFYACSLVASNATYLSAPPDISVFGDDIIIPTIYVNNMRSIFKVFGFVTNLRKSFNTGFFRESCGGDFYLGENVRGYNAKALPQTPQEWIAFTNAVRRVCYTNNNFSWRSPNYESLWFRLIKFIPEDYRLFGPVHYGDVCINTEDDHLYTIKQHRWNGEYIKVHTTRGGSYTSVDREISESRISFSLAERVVNHESLKGHGKRRDMDKDFNFLSQDEEYYPNSILKSTVGISYHNKWIPYTLYGQAPEDLGELAEHLCSANAQFLKVPKTVPRRYAAELAIARHNLIDLLKERSHVLADAYFSDEVLFQDFKFD